MTAAGVLYNNGVNNFAVIDRRNRLEPGKQPRSSISPSVLVKDGRPFIVLGSPGANRIISTVVTLICQKADPALSMESRFSHDVMEGMKKKGHTLTRYGDFDLFFGGSQIILVDPVTKMYHGSADPRRGGTAMGY